MKKTVEQFILEKWPQAQIRTKKRSFPESTNSDAVSPSLEEIRWKAISSGAQQGNKKLLVVSGNTISSAQG